MIIAFLTNLVILFYLINLYKLIIIYSQNWTSLTLTEPRNAYIMEQREYMCFVRNGTLSSWDLGSTAERTVNQMTITFQ